MMRETVSAVLPLGDCNCTLFVFEVRCQDNREAGAAAKRQKDRSESSVTGDEPLISCGFPSHTENRYRIP